MISNSVPFKPASDTPGKRTRAWFTRRVAPGMRMWRTGVENKPDPIIGLTSISPIMNALLIDLPYGDGIARQNIDDFFAQELSQHPMSSTTDRLMALWFFILKANEGSEKRYNVVLRRVTPVWARVHGLRPPPKSATRVA